MEYEFSFDERQRPKAHFSMEAFAFGPWLSDECNTLACAEQLLSIVENISSGLTRDYEHTGLEQRLVIESGEVTVSALVLLDETTYELDEALNLYDEDLISGCGIDDFKTCLQAWRDFLSEQCGTA